MTLHWTTWIMVVFGMIACVIMGAMAMKERYEKEFDELMTILKGACDRDWKDETPRQIVNIAANAIYWRDREIEKLRNRK